ncbi:winged helix-turn-helix transcriptional regulator [Elioraea sp.]|uniref:winged helix-turn-helix transcriptional regulator n=1 Tax=Elioraea sp. TaxID=2185103 RepID=UPI003F72E441
MDRRFLIDKYAQCLYRPRMSRPLRAASLAVAACPVEATAAVIGGKWKAVILFQLTSGPKRFNELRRRVPEITQRMLTLQLRALEAAGVVSRTVHDHVPPKVEYALTERGWALGPVCDAMCAWGERYGAKPKSRATPSPSRARSGASR